MRAIDHLTLTLLQVALDLARRACLDAVRVGLGQTALGGGVLRSPLGCVGLSVWSHSRSADEQRAAGRV